MKRTILATLIIATLVSCSDEETLSSHHEAITFDNAFVDNATRAIDGSYNNTANPLKAFQVYGTITNDKNKGTANIFDGDIVSASGTGWTYDEPQYWIPGNTYTFCAVADGNIEGATSLTIGDYDMPTAINLLDASQQKDILYAKGETVSYQNGDGAKTVSFIFSHLLAKAKFTVKNTISTDNGYSYQVSGLKIKDVQKNGVYDIASGQWKVAATPETYDLSFGNAVDKDADTQIVKSMNIGFGGNAVSNYERLLIPTDESLTITFSYQLLKDDAVIDTQEKTVYSVPTPLESGHAYNFIISLGNPGEPITFDVTKITDWKNEEKEI